MKLIQLHPADQDWRPAEERQKPLFPDKCIADAYWDSIGLAAKNGYGYYGLGGGFAQFYKTVADLVFQISIDVSTSGSLAFARVPVGKVWDPLSAERTLAFKRFMVDRRLEFQANCWGDLPHFMFYQRDSERIPLEVLFQYKHIREARSVVHQCIDAHRDMERILFGGIHPK